MLSVLVPHELRRPSQKATVLRKVFNVQHSGSKESHLFENIKDHHGASCFFPQVPALPPFPFQLRKTDVNKTAIYLKDAFQSSMQVYSLAKTNITRVPQTLPLCSVERQSKFICYRVIYMD